jgi:hypothetical protein
MIVALLLGGCRNRAAQELLERDLRVQEDIIYDLEDEVKALMSENEALRQMAFAGSPSDATSHSSDTSIKSTSPARRDDPPSMPSRATLPQGAPNLNELKPPTVEIPNKTSSVIPFEGPPAIIAPGEGFPEGELPGKKSVGASNSIPAKSASLGSSTSGYGPTMAGPSNAAARSEDVMTITLHETVTAGYNDDGQPGDDGIRVVVEPRSADQKILAAAAKISVVLMDPLLQGNASRIGRWDFTAEQAAASYAKSDDSEGLHLELPWYQTVPEHGELLLFVRYHTADGRKLDADRQVTIALRPVEQRTLPGQMRPQYTSQPQPAMRRGTQMPTQPMMPGGRATPQRRSPYSSAYDQVPATTQRQVWNRTGNGPTARLLPPEFQSSATPLEAQGPQPGAALAPQTPVVVPNSVAPSKAAPADTTTTDRPRTGAKWSPYR